MKHSHSSASLVRQMFLVLSIIALCTCFSAIALAADAQTTSPSFVRIIHASPDVGTADVFVDGKIFLSSFQFGAVTDYASIPPGPHKVQIALVGKGIGGAAITQTLAVSPGVAYTVAAIGTKQTGLSLEVFIDNNAIASGTTKGRLYQLSPNAGSVDLSAGGSTIVTGINYQQASNYVAFPQGSNTFMVSAPQVNTTLSTTATVKPGTVTSIFVVGLFNGNPKLSLVVAQTSGLPGLPGTGSDPRSLPTGSQSPATWLVGILALAMIGAIIFARRWLDNHA